MATPTPPPPPPVASDRCPRHDFPLDSAGCALCRQEAAAAGGQGASPAPLGATIPRGKRDPAWWIIGGALTFAGCIVPLVLGTAAGLLSWLIFDTGAKLSFGIGLGAAVATFLGVLGSR